MRWHDALHPVVMQRVALLAPREALRELLVNVADEGSVELDDVGSDGESPPTGRPALARLQRLAPQAADPALALTRADLDEWEKAGRIDLLAGEAQLEQHSAHAVINGSVAALVGWMPVAKVVHLAARVAPAGGSVVRMPTLPGHQPPTLLPPSGAAHEFAPLSEMYATVPYADVNPSLLAGLAYIAMFGMMFADVGHGALLLLAAVAIRLHGSPRLSPLRRVWLFLAGAGASSMVFGALYGEFFGPTNVVPVLWLAPLDHPVPLLVAAVAVGGVLLAGAYALGTVNRFREGGWRLAVYAPSGLAGAALFLGLGALSGGAYAHLGWLVLLGAAVALAGLVVGYLGLLASAGGGASGASQAAIELFDLVVRLGSNLVSFARLAAFGLTHAALGYVVWHATSALWTRGTWQVAAAVLIFLVGNALTFALEALVAGIQALRLEYYELFSRVFAGEGRPFRPWHIPLTTTEASC